MKNKKLYEYIVDNQLDYQFIKQISINEQTKTVLFELIVKNPKTNYEDWLIIETSDFKLEEMNLKIKDFLFATIDVEAFRENIYSKTVEQLDNGFKISGKVFLLKDNNYAELREKVINKVKEYGLH